MVLWQAKVWAARPMLGHGEDLQAVIANEMEPRPSAFHSL